MLRVTKPIKMKRMERMPWHYNNFHCTIVIRYRWHIWYVLMIYQYKHIVDNEGMSYFTVSTLSQELLCGNAETNIQYDCNSVVRLWWNVQTNLNCDTIYLVRLLHNRIQSCECESIHGIIKTYYREIISIWTKNIILWNIKIH